MKADEISTLSSISHALTMQHTPLHSPLDNSNLSHFNCMHPCNKWQLYFSSFLFTTQAPGRSPLISFFFHQMAPPPLLSPSRKHQRSSPHPLPFHLHGRPLLFPTFLSFSIKIECIGD
ncbi:hypothetical protein BDA96_02G101400 [Sorghum bicolor]|uniref:Uncharacterized protein n=2 Tax=Sorghum bicolor TaxID=4558 RepID=A0A921RP04_SORBI|nr:hypothetical protein BDA96_02G101300 [Sorghum bicolor]KAG0542408.1 hypothetical protein BDA96_02G101400 [Sorghum bicolor]OQU88798.1 hypothetical protein SORBI_3002G098050 [Sorghum bicolor]